MRAVIRPAGPEDAGLVLTLVRELATYENLLDDVEATEKGLAEALSGPSPRVFCEIAEIDGEPAGYVLWFYTFASFRGRCGIYLEDLFVRPSFRKHGLGRMLMARLAARCGDEGLGSLQWSVLKWNAPSIAFYESLGAVAIDAWTVYRVDGDALARLKGVKSARGRNGDEDAGR